MPTALVQGSIAIQYVHLLRKNLPLHWDILTWDPEQDSPDLFLEKAMEADVIIGGKIPLQSWPKLPKLKMFQIPWTSVVGIFKLICDGARKKSGFFKRGRSSPDDGLK